MNPSRIALRNAILTPCLSTLHSRSAVTGSSLLTSQRQFPESGWLCLAQDNRHGSGASGRFCFLHRRRCVSRNGSVTSVNRPTIPLNRRRNVLERSQSSKAEICSLIQYVVKFRVIEHSAPQEMIRKRGYCAPMRQDLEGCRAVDEGATWVSLGVASTDGHDWCQEE